jgi:hypothetical protein
LLHTCSQFHSLPLLLQPPATQETKNTHEKWISTAPQKHYSGTIDGPPNSAKDRYKNTSLKYVSILFLPRNALGQIVALQEMCKDLVEYKQAYFKLLHF